MGIKMFFSLMLLTLSVCLNYSSGYSALEDIKIIREYKTQMKHAENVRRLVHQANWASVGTISTRPELVGYPMVNILSIDDNTVDGKSSGKIRFLLVDVDFTGADWRKSNKVTFLFSNEQTLNCKNKGLDPMEPTCARAYISGQIKEMTKNTTEYDHALAAFTKRHPAASSWMHAHGFYLCELDIANILIIDFYGGPKSVTAEEYYKVELENEL